MRRIPENEKGKYLLVSCLAGLIWDWELVFAASTHAHTHTLQKKDDGIFCLFDFVSSLFRTKMGSHICTKFSTMNAE